MRRPSGRSLVLGLIPFVAMCLTVPLWDRVHPTFFGIPFNLFWLLCWIILSTGCLRVAYQIETARDGADGGTE